MNIGSILFVFINEKNYFNHGYLTFITSKLKNGFFLENKYILMLRDESEVRAVLFSSCFKCDCFFVMLCVS